jgi:hypothetical protein
MRYLVTTGKHVYSIQAIARQPSITAVDGLVESVFSVGSAPRLYSMDPRPAVFSWVKQLVRESESSVVDWQLTRVLHGRLWQEELIAGKHLAGAMVICELWRLVVALWLLVVPSGVYTWSVNSFTNPDPVYGHTPKCITVWYIFKDVSEECTASVFRVVFCLEVGGGRLLWNVGCHLRNYLVSYPRK